MKWKCTHNCLLVFFKLFSFICWHREHFESWRNLFRFLHSMRLRLAKKRKRSREEEEEGGKRLWNLINLLNTEWVSPARLLFDWILCLSVIDRFHRRRLWIVRLACSTATGSNAMTKASLTLRRWKMLISSCESQWRGQIFAEPFRIWPTMGFKDSHFNSCGITSKQTSLNIERRISRHGLGRVR